MPTPKTKVHIDSTGKVTFYDTIEETEYFLFELTRAALRDVGKFVMKEWKILYYQHFKKITGASMHAIKSKVYSSKNTMYPRVDVGLPHAYRGNPVDGYYAFFQEFGTSKTKRLGLLSKVVEENISTIREIESKYLKSVEDELEREKLISENGEEDIEDALE